MIIIRGINRIRRFKKPVVAMGVFDGVHRGHIKILRAAAAYARSIHGTAMVITFWPHPKAQPHLYSLEHRLKLFAECGIDVSVVINFNKKFSRISARDFVKNILFKKIHPDFIYIGENFNFGSGGYGDFKTLVGLSGAYGFSVKVFDVLKAKGQVISSTHIRGLIKRGQLAAAGNLLGRPVSVLGTVVRGQARGAKLGFPTANIDPHHEVIPPSGVYAVRVVYGGKKYSGVCNIGRKPTFKPSLRLCRRLLQDEHIEVYIFDFEKNIYGKYLEISFIKKIRSEKKFAAPSMLAAQISRDVSVARRLLSRR